MRQCINCKKSPLFILSFTTDYLNRFCKNCILDFADEMALCGTNIIDCHHCYNFDYEFRFKLCKMCNVKYCFNCRNYHIMFHYEKCNNKFKQDITPILEEFICKDVVENILNDYIEL